MGNRQQPIPLQHVERVYAMSSEQTVIFSQICEDQRHLETRIEYYGTDMPPTECFEISYQTGQRLILRVKDRGLVKDVWFVTHQSGDTIEMHTAQWFMKQTTFPKLRCEEKGLWCVSHTSAVGIALKRKGVPCTEPTTTLWSIYSSSRDTIILHSWEWYRCSKEARRPVVGAHRCSRHQIPTPSPRCLHDGHD
jgi:hypothetical protein